MTICLHFTGRQVFYTISGDNFSVDRVTGVITLKTPLDRERKDLLGNFFLMSVYILFSCLLTFFVYFFRCQSNYRRWRIWKSNSISKTNQSGWCQR